MQKQILDRLNNPVVIVLVVLLVISVEYIVFVPKSMPLEETDSSEVITETPISIESVAYTQAQSYVTEVLKTPSTAVFPPFDGIEITLVDPKKLIGKSIADPSSFNTENVYSLASYVDAQNAYGAMIRSEFWITLRFKGGDSSVRENWKLLILMVDGEDVTTHFLSSEDESVYQRCMSGGEDTDFCNKFLLGE